jgi:hypothetical protein
MTELNIVDLIENNPLTKLSTAYQSKLLTKIKDTFNDHEQKLFVASFYCYLSYNPKTDFVIDLDNVWEWMGFSKKTHAKYAVEHFLSLDNDYKIFAAEDSAAKTGRGGHNKIRTMLTVKAFKMLCLKAGTKKADQIHEYYIKLEETLQDVLNEETNELRIQLEEKNKQIENSETEKYLLREKTILQQFPNNSQCVYYGLVDDKTLNGEKLIKFGNSNFLKDRVEQHKRTFSNFRLMNAFKVENKIQIENAIKTHNILKEKRRSITVNSKIYTELLIHDHTSFVELDAIIKEIIRSVEYSPENYKKILKENDHMNKTNFLLRQEIENLKTNAYSNHNIQQNINISDEHQNAMNRILILEEENQRLKSDNKKLISRCRLIKNKNPITQPVNLEQINEIECDTITKDLKRISKSADGFYHIDMIKYKKCFGTREEVWCGDAFKTTGGLKKTDLILNKSGDIVSKKKFITEKSKNRFIMTA